MKSKLSPTKVRNKLAPSNQSRTSRESPQKLEELVSNSHLQSNQSLLSEDLQPNKYLLILQSLINNMQNQSTLMISKVKAQKKFDVQTLSFIDYLQQIILNFNSLTKVVKDIIKSQAQKEKSPQINENLQLITEQSQQKHLYLLQDQLSEYKMDNFLKSDGNTGVNTAETSFIKKEEQEINNIKEYNKSLLEIIKKQKMYQILQEEELNFVIGQRDNLNQKIKGLEQEGHFQSYLFLPQILEEEKEHTVQNNDHIKSKIKSHQKNNI